MALVLCTGADRVLLATRVMLLQRAGHTVIPTTSEPELLAACREHKFHVAVIGQGMSAPEKQRVFKLLTTHCPGVKILELYVPGAGRVLDKADDWLQVPAQIPQDLPSRVSALAEKSVGT